MVTLTIRHGVQDDLAETVIESGIGAMFRAHRWWVMRLAALPLHVLTFAIAIFLLVRLVPGDPAAEVAGTQSSTAQVEAIRRNLGLDGSRWHQLLGYLSRLGHLDLGTSILSGTSVYKDVATRLPQTLELSLMGIVGASALAAVLSSAAAFLPRSIAGRIARGYARTAGALPDFTLGIAGILVFYVVLHVAPAPIGRLNPRVTPPPSRTGLPFLDTLLTGNRTLIGSAAAHLVLPVVAMNIAYAPYLMRQLIPSLDQELAAPSTRFCVASGASQRRMVLYVARRALPPVLVVFGGMLGALLGGAVVMESMFGLGGLGQYIVAAVQSSDYPATEGALIVIVTIVLVIYLLVDLVTMVLDPRRRTETAAR
jgi:peptide/nickel transport system permease protein